MWAGSSARGDFLVKLVSPSGLTNTYECDPVAWARETTVPDYVQCVETVGAESGHRSLLPPTQKYFMDERTASVLGINIGGDCTSGAAKRYDKIDACCMSYDIETSTKNVREGGFALVDSPILSIAIKCSCGESFYTTSVGENATSKSLISKFFERILEHSPLWLVGWNCYTFDNECMRYHCDDALKALFRVSRIGAFGKPTYGSLVNIVGVYNVDVMVYMKRAMYAMTSFKLGDVAKTMGVTEKMDMPDMRNIKDKDELMEYNINDCVVVLDIWTKERLDEVIPSIALCSSSPVYDCCRYVTGTMATNAYASHMHSIGKYVEWNPVKEPEQYSGGYVKEPLKGVHKNVLVCDFSSMYPTIISSCNINPHDFSLERMSHSNPVGRVELGEHTTTVWLDGRVATFDRSNKSDLATLMEYLVRERTNVKKTYPMYSKSLKVVANSVYGVIGYSASWLYSPTCAAAVTAIGRHCVKLAEQFFVHQSMTALYMDTDSCMVTKRGPPEEVRASADAALERFHEHISHKSVREMKMVVEEHFQKSIMINKKKYCMLRFDGTMKIVGISIARRDVSQLCKQAARQCLKSLFMDNPKDTTYSISRFVSAVKQMSVTQSFTLSDVSKYTKKDGSSGYLYYSLDGTPVFVPEKEAVLSSPVKCDVHRLLKSVCSEIERFTVPCGYGGIADVMRSSEFL